MSICTEEYESEICTKHITIIAMVLGEQKSQKYVSGANYTYDLKEKSIQNMKMMLLKS